MHRLKYGKLSNLVDLMSYTYDTFRLNLYDNIHGRPWPTAVRGKPRCRSEAIMNKCV